MNDRAVQLVDWPVRRNNLVDFLRGSRDRNHVSGMWEVDITDTRARIRDIQRRTGTAISFNAYLAFLIARAVAKYPEVQAVRLPWRRKLAVFDGVDVGTILEHRLPDGSSIPIGYLVRDADRKSLADICRELREARRGDLLETHPTLAWRGTLARYPAPLRRLFWRWVDSSPSRRRRLRGTFGLTNLNFLADGTGPAFGIPISLLTCNLCVGGSYDRLVLDPDDPRGFTARHMICLTLQIDHDVVDGAPGLRFARHLSRALQNGHGLDAAFEAELGSEKEREMYA